MTKLKAVMFDKMCIRDRDWLFGRNYDLNYVPSMIVKSNPDHGYASIAVANISVLGYNCLLYTSRCV